MSARLRLYVFLLAVFATALSLCGCVGRRPETSLPVIADEEAVRIAIENLRHDEVKWNCHDALWYLYERREEICPYLVAALDTDDWQAQEALMRILCETEHFQPDERFIGLILYRLAQPEELDTEAHHSTHYDFIRYLTLVAPTCHAAIAEGITSEDIFVVWGTTYALYQSGFLEQHLAEYSSEVIEHIMNTFRQYGEMYAVRTCLMLGDTCLPSLVARSISSGHGDSVVAELLVRAIATDDREALDTLHLHYGPLDTPRLPRPGKAVSGMLPLGRILPHPSRPLRRDVVPARRD